MSYNAVLRRKNAEVFGKLTLSTLETLPKAWEVMYGEKFIPKTTDLKTLLCYSKFPLSVYTVPVEREITVKSLSYDCDYDPEFEDLEPFSVTKDVRVKDLKKIIFEWVKREDAQDNDIEFQDLTLYNDYERLEDSKIVEEFVFKRKHILRVKWRRINNYHVSVDKTVHDGRGGGGFRTPRPGPRCSKLFSSVNLKANHVAEKGVPVTNGWEGYSYGITIYGTCPNKSCRSHSIPLKQTSHRAGYGHLRIDVKHKTFNCPACYTKFPPANFVVCNARALFRFKKTGSHLEVESSLLQSFGGIDEYARFNDEGEDAKYDWIEVKTVKTDQSVHICSRCDIQIKMKVDAVLYDCGHPVHLACKEDECRICNAPSFSETEVHALVNRATAKTVVSKTGSGGTCKKRKMR